MKWIKTILIALIMTNTAYAKEFEKDTFKTPSGKEIETYAIKHGSMRIVFYSPTIMVRHNINKVEELLKGSGIEVRIRNYQ